MKEIMEKIGKITFLTIDEVYNNKERFRDAVLMLDSETKEVYKWYFYHQLCLLSSKQAILKDLMWEYLNGNNVILDLSHEYRLYTQKKQKYSDDYAIKIFEM